MAYTKQNWQCGDVVTDEKMNHIEQGIADAHECCESGGDGGAIFIHHAGSGACHGTDYNLIDISYQEIVDGLADGKTFWYVDSSGAYSQWLSVYARFDDTLIYPVYVVDAYAIFFDIESDMWDGGSQRRFFCDTEDGQLRDWDCWAPI